MHFIFAILLPLAHADDPALPEPKAKRFETPQTDVAAELGGIYTSGNSLYYTLSAKLSGSHGWGNNEIAIDALAQIGSAVADANADAHLDVDERADGLTESARRTEANLRYDRYISKRSSLYLLTGALADPFAGYRLRTHEQLGYSKIFIDGEATRMTAELGGDVAQEAYVEGVDPASQQIIAAHALLGLSHEMDSGVAVIDVAEVFQGLNDTDDTRVLNELAITSRLGEAISFKVSHKLAYDHQPVEGFETTDQTVMVTLIADLY